MRVLILEDDNLMAELLETVVAGIHPGVTVSITHNVARALDCWHEQGADLAILDWNLPDGSGLEVVKTIRRTDQRVPVVMVTGRADRDSVLQAAHSGINGFISKPFDITVVHDRLTALLAPLGFSLDPELDLQSLLEAGLAGFIQLPSALDPAMVLELSERRQTLSVSQLAERWQNEVALASRLLDVANSVSFRRTGAPVHSLRDAIGALGVDMALNQALALALDVVGQLPDPRLSNRARAVLDDAGAVAGEARRLAMSLGRPGTDVFSAGLLSRVGELAVIKVLQQYLSQGGALADEEIDASIGRWAQAYGNRLKIQWRLPLGLRELIGAVHRLPRDSTSQDQILMRAAALRAAGQGDGEPARRLMRRVGLTTAEDNNNESG